LDEIRDEIVRKTKFRVQLKAKVKKFKNKDLSAKGEKHLGLYQTFSGTKLSKIKV
jgi:hypothetical protein